MVSKRRGEPAHASVIYRLTSCNWGPAVSSVPSCLSGLVEWAPKLLVAWHRQPSWRNERMKTRQGRENRKHNAQKRCKGKEERGTENETGGLGIKVTEQCVELKWYIAEPHLRKPTRLKQKTRRENWEKMPNVAWRLESYPRIHVGHLSRLGHHQGISS